MAVHAAELAIEPRVQNLRRYRRPLLLRLEHAHRSAVEDHVHRPARLGNRRSIIVRIGISSFSAVLGAKRLELLRELVPKAAVFVLLNNPDNADAETQSTEVKEAARSLGLQLHILHASREHDIETAFATVVQLKAGALVIGTDAFLNSRREKIVTLAAQHAVPAISSFREYAVAGGLMSYGTRLTDVYRQMGIYVGRILKGEKPGDMPVLQPTKFELVINMKAAKALGLEVPPKLLFTADEVIE